MNMGGAETFLMKVYRNLDRTQYQMDFAVAIEESGAYDEEIKSLGGKIFHITPKSKGLINNFRDIKNIVKSEHYNYVLRTSQHALSALELLAAWLGGAKVRVFRSSNSNVGLKSRKQYLIHIFCRFMPKWFANVKIAPSTEAAEFMFGKGCISNGRANILHNGIDLSAYQYDENDRIKVRLELGVSDTTLLVGHIGRFSQQKNHAFLLEIFKTLHDNNENTKLILVGKGELEDKIRQQVHALDLEEYVIFTGVRSDVATLLSAMDVFVMPSFYEGMPNTVIEAQATGLPCVIADTITREADITGLVKYISLNKNTLTWSDEILTMYRNCRYDTTQKIYEYKYDIHNVVREFVNVVFQKKRIET